MVTIEIAGGASTGIDWSAIEAVGTLAAVIVALGTSLWAATRDARAERVRARAKVRALRNVVVGAEALLEGSAVRMRVGTPVSEAFLIAETDALGPAIRALESLGLADLPDPELVDDVMGVRSQLSLIAALTATMSREQRFLPSFEEALRNAHAEVSRRAANVRRIERERF